MRWSLLSALLVVAGAGVGCANLYGADGACTTPACANGCNSGSGCASCDACKGKCHGCCLSRGYEGLDRHFNCSCNGSYKFPVPPLSTYHWPGMYSRQLMTDYHSPWRFPPLKPYADEHLKPYPSNGSAPGSGGNEALPPAPPSTAAVPQPEVTNVQAAEYATSAKVIPGAAESMSDKLQRSSRYEP